MTNRILLWIAVLAALPGTLLPPLAVANTHGPGRRPYLGWSSWSLEATKYREASGAEYGGEAWLTADHVLQQSELLHQLLQKHGYRYVNIDSGWKGGYDALGRPTADLAKFPQGIEGVARIVHRRGQKLGLYTVPGIDGDLYKLNPPIEGTPYHIQDIVFHPQRPANGWGWGYKIDYSQPGAQAYIESVARQFARWGIDFLKLDGVTPGSDHHDLKIDARPDVRAWSLALRKTHRPIWLTLSWNLDLQYRDTWQKYANAWRITDDVDIYGKTLTAWFAIAREFDATRADWQYAGPGKGWNDMDSLDIGCGAMDGLTEDERQTTMSLWAMECAPIYSGDDLSKLDAYGLKLLTNDEVIRVDQAGHPARPVVFGPQQVWTAAESDGSRIVALFNLGSAPAAVTARWADLGLSGPARLRDLWNGSDLGPFDEEFTSTLPPHGSRLLRLSPIQGDSTSE